MGIGDAVAGKAKEAAGKVTGNEELEAEGDAQSTKGVEETKATKDEAKAEAHEKKADMAEAKQEAAEENV